MLSDGCGCIASLRGDGGKEDWSISPAGRGANPGILPDSGLYVLAEKGIYTTEIPHPVFGHASDTLPAACTFLRQQKGKNGVHFAGTERLLPWCTR